MSDQKLVKSPTTAADWKESRKAVPLDVPSGKTCLVEPRSLDFWVRTGKVPNRLMPLAQKAVATGSDLSEEELWKAVEEDPEFLQEMMQMVDTVVVFQVKAPVVHAVPTRCKECSKLEEAHKDLDHEWEAPDREEDKLYVDEVDLNDKMAVFAFVTGGVRDLESFLQESRGNVPSGADGEGLESPAEQPAGDRG